MTKMVLHMSRDQAINFDPSSLSGKWAMLSISEPNQPPPKFKHEFQEVVCVQFLDREHPKDSNGPTQAIAYKIQKALETWVEQDYNIAVHCFAGVSRSAAVAKHLEQYSPDARMHKYINANKLLLPLLKEAEKTSASHVYLAKRTAYLGYAYPYDLNKRKRVCLDCGGLGCEHCTDGFVEAVIIY